MARFTRDLVLNKPDDFVQFIMNDFLQKNQFEMSDWKGEAVFRAGDAMVEGFKYLKWTYNGGVFHLEAWLKGMGGGEMDLDGFVGTLQKKPYRESLEQLFAALQQPLPANGPQDMSPQGAGPQGGPQPIPVQTVDNSGAAIARNYGIRNASGDYIAFMDADDFYPNNYALERLFTVAVQQQMNICGGSAKFDSSENWCDEKRVFKHEGTIQFVDYQFDFLFYRFIYCRSFLLKNQIEFPNLRVYEDPVFLLKAMISAREFYVIPDEVYQYTGSHQSHSMTIVKTKDYIKGITETLKITADYQLEELHQMTFKRLEQDVCYYAGMFLYTEEDEIFRLMIAANAAIDREMIGLEHDYILPWLLEVWRASYKYMKLRNSKIFKAIRKIIRK